MNLKQQLDLELNRLFVVGLFDSGPETASFDTDVGRLQIDFTGVDQLAVSFEEMRLEADRLANASMDDLKKLAGKLADNLTYLLEPIRLVEADEEACEVQMRSAPPQKSETGPTYYELTLRRGGSIALCRYHKPRRQSRHIVPANVTQEVLLRLGNDLVEAVR